MLRGRPIFFSGIGSLALVPEGEEPSLVFEKSIGVQPYRSGEIEWLKHLDHDYFESPDLFSMEEAEAILAVEKSNRETLFFLLASFDKNLDTPLRLAAAELVDESLANPSIRSWLEAIVLSQPLNVEPELFGMEAAHLVAWTEVKNKIEVSQDSLRTLWSAIGFLNDQETVTNAEQNLSELISALLSSGAATKLAAALLRHDSDAFNRAIVDFAVNPTNARSFPLASRTLTKLRVFLNDSGSFSRSGVARNINATESDGNSSSLKRGVELTTHESFTQVRKQIEGIRKLLLTGNALAVDKALSELLTFHHAHGEVEHLAKSLCSLTKIALDANELNIADSLSARAMNLAVDDIIVLSSRAEVLKNFGRFQEASALYKKMIETYGEERYALCGYADALQDQGNFLEASKIYAKSKELYPEDPVASNGMVGVLLAQGNSAAALRSARKNVITYRDEVSRVVLASVLRHMGHYAESVRVLDEALIHFRGESRIWFSLIRSLRYAGDYQRALSVSSEFLKNFKEIPGPFIIRAEVLRSMGRFKESLEMYVAGQKVFPQSRLLGLGKAAVQVLLGNISEATALADGLELESEIDWRSYHVFCVSLLRSSAVDGLSVAIEKLTWGLENVPWKRLKSSFSDALGYAKLKQGRFSEAGELLNKGLNDIDQEKRSSILLFLGTIHSQTGRTDIGNNLLQMASPKGHSGKVIKSFLQEATKSRTTAELIIFPLSAEIAALDVLLGNAA